MKRIIGSSFYYLAFVATGFGVFCPHWAAAQTGKNPVPVNYTYPAANSANISAKTRIGIRYAEAVMKSSLDASAFIITGSSSGLHNAKVTVALDGRTVILTPDKTFSSGETVVVTVSSLKCTSGMMTSAFSLTFRIARSKVLPHGLLTRERTSFGNSSASIIDQPIVRSISSNDTLPDDFPAIYVTKSNNPAPGNIYLADFRFTRNDSGTYLIILDNAGNVLFERSAWPTFDQDFKPQPNGLMTYFDSDPGVDGTEMRYKFYGLDSTYVVRDSFEAANGYLTDDHELIFLPGGGYALLAQIDEQIDMRKFVSDGDSNTTVVEGVLQEFDAAKHLIFEWRTRDHFSLSDPTYENFSSTFLDFTHCNSIENDGDTAFILSSRNLDEVTKISREDGHIIWRWGGKNNEFTFVGDSLLFSHQHSVRKLANGNIIMFDNGKFHNTAQPFSRAVEYRLDEAAKVATKVWEYHHDPDVYGDAMGNVEQLPGGNRLIGWGGCDSVAVTEITPDGSTALEIRFDPGVYSYRAFKYTKDELKQGISTQGSSPVLSLGQNYPNPCSSSSMITFTVGGHAPVELALYDQLGRKVKELFEGTVDAGTYSAKCDAGNLPGGAYIYRLSTPSTSLSRIMLLQK